VVAWRRLRLCRPGGTHGSPPPGVNAVAIHGSSSSRVRLEIEDKRLEIEDNLHVGPMCK
jgi:hypothetical protein